MEKTPVEWLFDELIELNADMKYHIITWEDYLSKRADLLDQAKEMEKEQIMDAVNFGDTRGKITTYSTAEEYYNKTFKSE